MWWITVVGLAVDLSTIWTHILNHVIDYADNRVVIQTMMLDVVVKKWRKMSDHTVDYAENWMKYQNAW